MKRYVSEKSTQDMLDAFDYRLYQLKSQQVDSSTEIDDDDYDEYYDEYDDEYDDSLDYMYD